MFPIPWNFPFRKKDGSLGKIEDLGGTYTLPTASANTKGGVKVGSGLSIENEVLSADAELPSYGVAEAGKVLCVDENGDLEWDTKGTGGGIIESHYEAYTSSSTQTRTYEKTVIIPEDGYYLICVGTYVDNFSLKINDVAESETGTISQDYLHTYFNAAKQLQKDDEIEISLSSSGRAIFTSIIVKTEAPIS